MTYVRNVDKERERSKRRALEHRIAKWGIEYADVCTRGMFGHSRGIKKPNEIISLGNGMSEVVLSQGRAALIDDCDMEKISGHRWIACKDRSIFYARTHVIQENGLRITVSMHRKIMNFPRDLQIDHIDGNGLNNTRSNLRLATARMNSQNKHSRKTSKCAGVCWIKSEQRWRARIEISGKERCLGFFLQEIDAARAYAIACLENGFELPIRVLV